MLKRIITFIISITLIVTLAAGCSNAAAQQTPSQKAASTSADSSNQKVFTKEELSKYNGQNGNPAYVAVDGTVYDVTNVPQWKGGKHNGYEAGKDLTDEIKNKSPHGVSKLNGLPVVGKLKN